MWFQLQGRPMRPACACGASIQQQSQSCLRCPERKPCLTSHCSWFQPLGRLVHRACAGPAIGQQMRKLPAKCVDTPASPAVHLMQVISNSMRQSEPILCHVLAALSAGRRLPPTRAMTMQNRRSTILKPLLQTHLTLPRLLLSAKSMALAIPSLLSVQAATHRATYTADRQDPAATRAAATKSRRPTAFKPQL